MTLLWQEGNTRFWQVGEVVITEHLILSADELESIPPGGIDLLSPEARRRLDKAYDEADVPRQIMTRPTFSTTKTDLCRTKQKHLLAKMLMLWSG